MTKILKKKKAPVVIGGIGGSGTRLIAECLQQCGYYMGSDLNPAKDNLWFTLLFKRIDILTSSDEEIKTLIDILTKAMISHNTFTNSQIKLIAKLSNVTREKYPIMWLRQRANTLLLQQSQTSNSGLWGWKEPNSHIVLDKLIQNIKGFKYIHVIRNGLDMAYSINQNQLILWGDKYLRKKHQVNARYSLKYWCAVHKRVIGIGETMGSNFLLLNYDEFCLNPEKGITELCNFLGFAFENYNLQLSNLIQPIKSINKYKQHNSNELDNEDVAYVKSLGFTVD